MYHYLGAQDYIAKRDANKEQCYVQDVGKESTILPSSFKGSPRQDTQRYHNAMTICGVFGKPGKYCN